MSNKETHPDEGLHAAVVCNKPELIDELLAAGADVNTRMTNPDEAVELNQVTALYMAARFGKIECLKRLLAAGADVNAADAHQTTPLHVVAYNNDLKKLSAKTQLECVQLLLEAGADVHLCNEPGDTPLHYAAQSGNAEVVRALLEAGSDANSRDKEGYQPIHSAAFHGHMEIIRQLLAAGADINSREGAGFTPLALATIYYGTAEDLRELIQLGADVSTVTDEGTNLLHHAANSLSPWPDQEKKMEEVLKHGPDVNAVSLNGHTPLLSAAIRFFEKKAPFECVELLVQAGADVRVRHNNTSLLHVAAASGQPEMLSLLLKAGASATEADDNGNTPLAYAYLLSRKLHVPRATRNKIIHLLLAAAPELKKKLTTLKRRYWFNKLLNFILLLVVLRFLWLLLRALLS